MALAVPYRLWLGGVVSPVRDLGFIGRLVALVRLAWRPGRTLLIGVDGLASYVTAFREKVHTGRRGRPPYRLPGGMLLGQVIKKHSGRRLVEVVRRVVWGSPGRINRMLKRTGTGRQINTSYIERLNATFRSRLASLVRRGRSLAHKVESLEFGMYLVGCVYNLCTAHRSLRVAVAGSESKWQGRTPSMAANWADRVWSVSVAGKEGAGEDILLIDIKGLARMLGRSERALWRDHGTGRLPCPIRLGGMTKWRVAEIRAWVAAGCPDRTAWEATRRLPRRAA